MQTETGRTDKRLGGDSNEPTSGGWVARSEDIHVRNHGIAEQHSVELGNGLVSVTGIYEPRRC